MLRQAVLKDGTTGTERSKGLWEKEHFASGGPSLNLTLDF